MLWYGCILDDKLWILAVQRGWDWSTRALAPAGTALLFGQQGATVEWKSHSGVACDCPKFGQHMQRGFWLEFLDKHHMQVTLGPIMVKISGTWLIKLGHHAYYFLYKVKRKREDAFGFIFPLFPLA